LRLSMRPDNRVGAVIDYSERPYPFRFRQLIVTAPLENFVYIRWSPHRYGLGPQ
jgi:hypothetical protein